MVLAALACLLLAIPLAAANTEKTIFLGPETVNIPAHSTSLAALNIDTLTPEKYSLRTHLDAPFPTDDSPKGAETWLLLQDLTEGQRYEVRVCWMATQPTSFDLQTYPLDTVFADSALITSLHNYSTSRALAPPLPPARAAAAPRHPQADAEHHASLLLLRITAAAAYVTPNAALMARPAPVLADLVLDPFLANVLPRSLAPTVAYVAAVALVSWLLAWCLVVPALQSLLPPQPPPRVSSEAVEEKTKML